MAAWRSMEFEPQPVPSRGKQISAAAEPPVVARAVTERDVAQSPALTQSAKGHAAAGEQKSAGIHGGRGVGTPSSRSATARDTHHDRDSGRVPHSLGEAEMVWEERDRERDACAEMERDDRDPAYGASSPWDDAIGREW